MAAVSSKNNSGSDRVEEQEVLCRSTRHTAQVATKKITDSLHELNRESSRRRPQQTKAHQAKLQSTRTKRTKIEQSKAQQTKTQQIKTEQPMESPQQLEIQQIKTNQGKFEQIKSQQIEAKQIKHQRETKELKAQQIETEELIPQQIETKQVKPQMIKQINLQQNETEKIEPQLTETKQIKPQQDKTKPMKPQQGEIKQMKPLQSPGTQQNIKADGLSKDVKKIPVQKECHSVPAPDENIDLQMECYEELLSAKQAEAALKSQLHYNLIKNTLKKLHDDNVKVTYLTVEEAWPEFFQNSVTPMVPSVELPVDNAILKDIVPNRGPNIITLAPAASVNTQVKTVIPIQLTVAPTHPMNFVAANPTIETLIVPNFPTIE